MINLENYATDFIERDGILFSKKESNVSYPKKGSENFFQIEDNSFWFAHRNNCIISGVLRYSPKNLFYDIGGGNGYVSKGLQDNNVPTVLVEPSIQGCINAKKRNLKTVICSTLENAVFKENTIPAAGLFDVVEHIEKDQDFLKTIHTFIRTNGLVFITVPAFNILWSNEDTDDGHFRRYKLKELEEKLRVAGFTIEYSTYIFSILPIPIFLFRTLPSKLGLNKKSNNLDKHKREHEKKSGFFDSILNLIWRYELNKINKGEKIPSIGGSCFVIARKN